MKTAKKTLIGFCILMVLDSLLFFCNKSESCLAEPAQEDTTIIIPPGDVTVACYYFPNWDHGQHLNGIISDLPSQNSMDIFSQKCPYGATRMKMILQ